MDHFRGEEGKGKKKKKEEQLMKLPSIGAVQELVQRRM